WERALRQAQDAAPLLYESIRNGWDKQDGAILGAEDEIGLHDLLGADDFGLGVRQFRSDETAAVARFLRSQIVQVKVASFASHDGLPGLLRRAQRVAAAREQR